MGEVLGACVVERREGLRVKSSLGRTAPVLFHRFVREASRVDATRQDLEDAGCWFDADKVCGPEMTAFKREARWRQHRWAVDELSIIHFGTHAGRRTEPDVAPQDIPNGTKLRGRDAEAGSNFLSPAIFATAQERVLAKQEHETLDATRLYRDLLSSMPMAFNLFGEASLPENELARARLAKLFGVDTVGPSDVVFEWSPGRRNMHYTRDRTAFDVALRHGDPAGPRTVIGIETKYHEHSAKEKAPSSRQSDALRRYQEQTNFLVAIAERSGAFKPGWQESVLGTDLRQIWRDHLLALSMRQNQEYWTPETRYVLIYPQRNVSFKSAAQSYTELLVDGDTSFQAFTIESVVEAAFAVGEPTQQDFKRRYLW